VHLTHLVDPTGVKRPLVDRCLACIDVGCNADVYGFRSTGLALRRFGFVELFFSFSIVAVSRKLPADMCEAGGPAPFVRVFAFLIRVTLTGAASLISLREAMPIGWAAGDYRHKCTKKIPPQWR